MNRNNLKRQSWKHFLRKSIRYIIQANFEVNKWKPLILPHLQFWPAMKCDLKLKVILRMNWGNKVQMQKQFSNRHNKDIKYLQVRFRDFEIEGGHIHNFHTFKIVCLSQSNIHFFMLQSKKICHNFFFIDC